MSFLRQNLSRWNLKVLASEHPQTRADEIMVSSQIFDHAARLRSYAIVAEVMGHAVPALSSCWG